MKNNYKKHTLEKEKLSLINIHTEQQGIIQIVKFQTCFSGKFQHNVFKWIMYVKENLYECFALGCFKSFPVRWRFRVL